jgi:Ca2+-binding RTX toxin-like protein
LDYLETDNSPPCDPTVQVSARPCDDRFTLSPKTVTTHASGVTWHFELLGWRKPDGTFSKQFTTEETEVTQGDVYGKVTIDTNPTASVLSVNAGTLSMTTTPVPQTGGTVDFTDGGDPIASCTDVPVDTTTGIATCTPALSPGAHTLSGGFGGSFGYAPSQAADVAYSNLASQTVTFDAPVGLTYGDADVPLGATATSGLPVSYVSSTPSVCTTEAGNLHIVASGSCTITASQAGNESYSHAEQARTFDIAKAALTVTADNKSRAAGEANPTFTATITGYVNGDLPDVVAGSPTLSTTATASSPPGTYPIEVSTASMSAANYDFAPVNGTLTVRSAEDPFAACDPSAPTPPGYRLIKGGTGNDVIAGTTKNDLIRAGAGNDLVSGAGGDDIICGGPGNDVLGGGAGADLVDGGPGIDFLLGGPGVDRGRDPDVMTFQALFEQFN